MKKVEIYNQIESFNQNIIDSKETRTNKYYYTDSKEAEIKARFIKFLVEKDLTIESKLNSVSTIMDLAYGSGNLTSHIVLECNLNYRELILNDKFIGECNQELKGLLDYCTLKDCDFFDPDCFDESKSIDLLIFDPTHGGKPPKKDYVHKDNKNFQALNNTLEKILSDNSIVIFRGSEEDFGELYFSKFSYQNIYMDGDSSLFVAYNIDVQKKKCYEYVNNEFVINEDCKKKHQIIEEDMKIGTLVEELDELKEKEDKSTIIPNKEHQTIDIKEQKQKFSSTSLGNLDFPYRNILFKGVPGTGKSRAIDNIISKHLILEEKYRQNNTLRINIHSASSNADLMQGIGISTKGQNIIYEEKQGLILDFIRRATYLPNQPFALVLEEIQENSLNELIGDLIYLIDEEKRTVLTQIEEGEYSYTELVQLARKSHEEENKKLLKHEQKIFNTVKMPNLVSGDNKYKEMILPDNLYIFCTSNYRDDKKIIEDNLLRRFEVIEIYPNKDVASEYVQEFLESLNTSILTIMQENHEIHPDRYMIGHAIWKDVKKDGKSFYRAFLKLITEFKDIREIEFDIFKNIIKGTKLPDDIEVDIETKESYFDLIQYVQNKIAYDFLG